MSEPTSTAEIPELDIRDYGASSLMLDLTTGRIALPVWLRIGHARHKVTPENRDGIFKGLLIAVELRTQDL